MGDRLKGKIKQQYLSMAVRQLVEEEPSQSINKKKQDAKAKGEKEEEKGRTKESEKEAWPTWLVPQAMRKDERQKTSKVMQRKQSTGNYKLSDQSTIHCFWSWWGTAKEAWRQRTQKGMFSRSYIKKDGGQGLYPCNFILNELKAFQLQLPKLISEMELNTKRKRVEDLEL